MEAQKVKAKRRKQDNEKREAAGSTGPVQPIICLSTQDYTDLWTRKQRFMTWFAERGHTVIYVQSQWHWLTWLKRNREDFWRPLRFLRRPQQVRPNLHIATAPILLPFHQMFLPVTMLNNVMLGLWLRWLALRLKIRRPLVYAYVPYSQLAIRLLGAKKVLYEKVDDLAAAKGLIRRSTVEKLERRFLGICKVVIVTATRLKDKMRELHPNVHVIPNACDVAHFQTAAAATSTAPAMENIPHPRIGFVGMLAYWIDQKLVEYIAAHRPQWQIVFIGPVAAEVTLLKRYTNIHFLGRQPYDDLPALMREVDVFINPYKRDDVAESCSPLKVFEYLACGKPVVSVPMPEVMRFAPHVRIAEHYVGFVRAIDELLALPDAERKQLEKTLRGLVREDTWENRFEQTNRLIAEGFTS